MKWLILADFFCGVTSFAQNNQKFTIKGAKSVDDLGYVSKRKVVDCNKELEWEEGSTVVFLKDLENHTGTCVLF